MGSGKSRLRRAVSKKLGSKADKQQLIPGLLGAYIGSSWYVSVPGRQSYVYVRAHNNDSEVIQAFNDQVSPILNLPVVLTRDELTPNYYRVLRRDIAKYQDWPPQLSYHARQHEYGGTGSMGSDIVWVQKKQYVPLSVHPSGVSGTYGCTVDAEYYQWNNNLEFFSGANTPSFEFLRPNGIAQGVFVGVYLEGETGELKYLTGTEFTHTPWPAGYRALIPTVPMSEGIPLAGILLTHEMKSVSWDQIYDIRPTLGNGGITGTAPGEIAGEGTNTFLPRWSGSSYLGNSAISDDGSTIFVGEPTNISGSLVVTQTIQPGAYAQASLPAAGTAGRIARVTDEKRGLWMDQGDQWFALNNEVFNVKEFGVRGDGITDDFPAIQAVVALASDGDTIFFPPGNYFVSGTVYASGTAINVIGSGLSTQVYEAANASLFHLCGMEGITIREMYLGSSATSEDACLLHIERVHRSYIQQIAMRGGGRGIYEHGCISNSLNNIRTGIYYYPFFHATSVLQDGIVLSTQMDAPLIASNANRLYNPILEHCRNGILFDGYGQGGISIYGGTLEFISGTAICVANSYLPSVLSGIHLEEVDERDLYVSGSTSFLAQGIFGDSLTLLLNSKGAVLEDCYLDKIEVTTGSVNCSVLRTQYNGSGGGYIRDFGFNTKIEDCVNYGQITNLTTHGNSVVNGVPINFNGGMELWSGGLPIGFSLLSWGGHVATVEQTGDGCADTTKRFGSYAAKITGHPDETWTGLLYTLPSAIQGQEIATEVHVCLVTGSCSIASWWDYGAYSTELPAASTTGTWQRSVISFANYNHPYSVPQILIKLPNGSQAYIDNLHIWVNAPDDPSAVHATQLQVEQDAKIGGNAYVSGIVRANDLEISNLTTVVGGASGSIHSQLASMDSAFVRGYGNGITGSYAIWMNPGHITGSTHLFGGHSCRLTMSAPQTITGTNLNLLSWDVVSWDTEGIYDAGSPHLMTCKTAGVYLVICGLGFDPNATGRRAIVLYKNDTGTVIAVSKVMTITDAGQNMAFQAMGVANLTIGDIIFAYALQASGGSLDTVPTPSFLSMMRIA